MEEVIIIKYGELSTKSDNINFFLKTLKNNIVLRLEGLEYDLKYDYGRMIIKSEKLNEVLNRINNVFGIHEISKGYLFKEKDLEIIKNNVLNLIKDKEFNTFKVNGVSVFVS